MIMPPPKEKERIRKTTHDKRRGKTAILTSSPYKRELEEEERTIKIKKVPKRKLFMETKINTNKKPKVNLPKAAVGCTAKKN